MNVFKGKISARAGRFFTIALLAYALVLQGFLTSNLATAQVAASGEIICLSGLDHGAPTPDGGHVDCSCPGLCAQAFAFIAPDAGASPVSFVATEISYSAVHVALAPIARRATGLFARGPPEMSQA